MNLEISNVIILVFTRRHIFIHIERNIHFFLEHGGLHVLFSLLESLDMACDGVLGVVIAIGHVLEFAGKVIFKL